jgi:hypothetical protein
VDDPIAVAFIFGGIVGAWLGFHVGAWRAATRAAQATYRTQRGLSKRR